MSSDLDRWLEEATCPKINLFSSLKMHSHTSFHLLSFFSPSPLLLGATAGYKQGVMRGRGRSVQDGRVIMTPAFVISIACYRSLATACCLITYVLNLSLSWGCTWSVHTHLHTHMQTLFGHLFSLLLNTVILCLLMGTGSSVPRVPLDNWLLPHLLTSPPLTFLHFTFKVLHISPFNFYLIPPSSDLLYLLLYFFFHTDFTSSSLITLCKIESQFPAILGG